MNCKKRFLGLVLSMTTLVGTLALTTNASDSVKSAVGIVDASALRLREGPGTDTEILTTAYRNDYVVILESEGDWYKVIYNLREGYMHSDYLTVKERENVELGYGEVNTYLVNLRSGPTTSSEILDQLAEGEDAYIIGFNCGWYKVQYNGSTGYIRSDLVDLTEIPYENTGSSSSPKYFAGGDPISSSSYESSERYDAEPESSESYEQESEAESYESYEQESEPESSESYEPETSESYEQESEPESSESYESESSGNASSSYSAGEAIVAKAKEYLGVPYVWGGSSPSGFDCSGFTQYVMRACGYSIYRTATDQLENGYAVSYSDLQPGDLVFFERTYNTDAPASHVGIYVGGGEFIHAGGSYVKISSLSSDYYASRYVGARRIV